MAEKISIAILDDYQNVALKFADWDQLSDSATIKVFNQHMPETDDVISALFKCDVVCIMRERTPFTRDIFERLPNLKLLITSGSFNASIDLQAATDNGVVVGGTNSPGHAASELAWGLMMSLSRHIVAEDQSVRSGSWQTTIGRDIKGQTLGIIGLGRHGSNMARYAQAFGMNVIAWSQNLTQERCEEVGVKLVDKDTLYAESDIMTIHLKMGSRYRNLIDSDAFSKMKKTAYLINTSRGPIINETDLISAINKQQISGAGLDVFEHEPLPVDHPLRTLPNTVLTSHVGYVTEQTYEVFYGETLEVIKNWMNGQDFKFLN